MYSLWLISSVTLVQFQWPTVSTLVSRGVLSCGMGWNSLCSGMLKTLKVSVWQEKRRGNG